MIGKSRRSKRRKSPLGKTAVTVPQQPTQSKVVSLATRRKRRPQRSSPGETTAIKPKVTATAAPLTRTSPPGRSLRRPIARPNRRFRLKLPKPILYPLRFLIVGVGIGAFIGTLLAISNSRSYLNVTQGNVEEANVAAEQAQPTPVNPLPLKTPLTDLAATVKADIAADSELKAALLFVDLDTGEYLDVDSTRSLSAASTIKIPVLVAFLEAVDAGKVKLDDTLTLTEAIKGTGAGSLQYKPVGSTYSALYVATEMSVNSDNTATNMIIEHLGGSGVLNGKFKQWGINQTVINNPLPDLDGTNTTSAKDLAYLMARINQGEILSTRSRDRLFRIMSQTENDRLLPQSLGEGANIVHKTGDIGFIIGDAGIVDMPNGKRYVASIFVERPYDSPKGKELLHKISKRFYDYLNQTAQPPAPATPPTNGATNSENNPPTAPTTPPTTTPPTQPPAPTNETNTAPADTASL